MPKQLLHQGRAFTLIPMKEIKGDGRTVETIDRYHTGHLDEFKPEGAIATHEPSLVMMWSKSRDSDESVEFGPGDAGYVVVGMDIPIRRMIREVEAYKQRCADLGVAFDLDALPEPSVVIETDPLSWRDLNVTAKTAARARDDAFGKPE